MNITNAPALRTLLSGTPLQAARPDLPLWQASPVNVSRSSRDCGRLVIVSNRVVPGRDTQFGRLTMMLRDVLRQRGGLWFGWSGTITDTPALTTGQDIREGFETAAIDLDPQGHAALFDGFASRTLHPLLESRLSEMAFDREDLRAWFAIHARLAASLKMQLQPNDQIWIHGLHLLPLAAELRALGVNHRIGLFVHDALPSANIMASLPDHDRVFGALAACDVIGVQTPRDWRALHDYLTTFQGATTGSNGELRFGGRAVDLSVQPVGIDVKRMADMAHRAAGHTLFRRFRGNLDTHKLLVSIDRPDYASGLRQRLQAIDGLLHESPRLAGTFTLLQISSPVRYGMRSSRKFDREISHQVGDLNGRHGTPEWSPVRYVRKGFRQQVLAGFLRAARVGVMTPLCDGMTLAAKEYVACQDPSDPGVLVLSRFSGAAQELAGAVQVHPGDIAEVAAGIRTAMRMPLQERRTRWAEQMRALRRHDVQCWSDDCINALVRRPLVQIQV